MNARKLDEWKCLAFRNIHPDRPMVMVGLGTCGIGNGADAVFESFRERIDASGSEIILKPAGCFGFCSEEPLVCVYQPDLPLLIYHRVEAEDCPEILDSIAKGQSCARKALCRIEEWDHITSRISYGKGFENIPLWNEIPFFSGQKKIVLRNAGLIDPDNIEDYIAVGGYQALSKALSGMDADGVIREVATSKLRGRGGAGFPAARKWEMMKGAVSDKKYIICNADEGDPGAFMNRNELESDPHMLIEGMAIGAFAMGAERGVIYIRAEYPNAVKKIRNAIEAARKYGLLGANLFDSGFSFDLDVVEGAGAFVCGEETALIASIEGRAGRPMPRPPFPARKGLWGKPTNINNVETWCNIPVIVYRGGEWFAGTGSTGSTGTKVFSLVGKVKNTGLVELPLGTTLDTFIYRIGEGTGNSKKVKAVQTGGPSGGCIPAEHFRTPVDYESLAGLGAIMGSGGMVVMDQDNCMVDVARFFLEFTSSESCGKCTSCREGLSQAHYILTKITKGLGNESDLEKLELLSGTIKDSSICALGQTAPNPILTTLRYFRQEYMEHIREKRCRPGICESLYTALCENSCPLHMNIPAYIQLLKEDRLEEAFELTLRDNPIPGTIGRICHFHCQMKCRREMIDEPVSQGEIHRYIADTIYRSGKEEEVYQRILRDMLPPTGKKIAIVGAGPAGLTAAYYLVRLGHAVTVYDALPEAGGILRFGIPRYRLPGSVLSKEIDFIRKLGVRFVFNTRIGDPIPFRELENTNDAVYLTIGARKDVELDIPGVKSKGVVQGIEYLEEIAKGKSPGIGGNVLVIGAGNVAIDAARSIWRMGSKVTVVYRRERCDMPANRVEVEEAEAEGVEFTFLSAPEEILADPSGVVRGLKVARMFCRELDSSGRRKPEPTGMFDEIPCDTVVLALGEKVDGEMVKAAGLRTTRSGTIEVDPFTFRTSSLKVYAGGDAVSGPSTAAEAMGTAKKAASAIDEALTGEKRFHRLFKTFAYRNTVPQESEGEGTNRALKIVVRERIGNFDEVSCGYTDEQARMEVRRCLRCDVRDVGN
jgi:NADH-quinone oxidoreductase subunit F